MSDKYNKEEPSFLQKIQDKTGCLFLVIGVAMLAFVLTDLVSSGGSIFGSNDNSVGSIGGEKVSYKEYDNTYEGMKQQILQNNPGFQMTSEVASQYRDQAWNLLVDAKTIQNEQAKLGIEISPAELTDLTIGKNPHQQIKQSFPNPETREFDKERLIRFLKEDVNNDPKAKEQWNTFQEQFTANLKNEKYNALISNSYYATELDARTQLKEGTQTINAKIVSLNYAQNQDSSIVVTDSDINAFVKKNKSKYEQDASRDIEFVRIQVIPSAEDSAKMVDWAKNNIEDFAKSTDDSAFISYRISETPYNPNFVVRGTFSPSIETRIFAAEKGSVVGPIEENGVYSLYKISDVGTDSLRSVRGSHILFQVLGTDTAKAEADAKEVLSKIRSGASTFSTEASSRNFDATRSTGGDMGYVREESRAYPNRLIKRLMNSGQGNYVIVRSKGGVHLAKATSGVSKKTVQVSVLDQTLYSSTATDDAYYKQAGSLVTGVSDKMSFEEKAESEGLTKRVAIKIDEKTRTIPGLNESSKVARWLFDSETKVGDISSIIDLNGTYIVARVTAIREAGIPSAEELRSDVERFVKNEMIADKLVPKMEAALKNASSAEDLAKELETIVSPIPAASFAGASLPYLGQDKKISGSIFGVPTGGHSNVIRGDAAVAVVYVVNENKYEPGDLVQAKEAMTQELKRSTQTVLNEALKTKADIVDQRYRFYD
jgi:peptidyl-prolyl cis-trans isomerase D